MNNAQKIMELIIKDNLLSAQCAEDQNHPCIIVWSSQAEEQIEALIHALSEDRVKKYGEALNEAKTLIEHHLGDGEHDECGIVARAAWNKIEALESQSLTKDEDLKK